MQDIILYLFELQSKYSTAWKDAMLSGQLVIFQELVSKEIIFGLQNDLFCMNYQAYSNILL